MSSIRALIFDVDGTLAETEELHRRAFNETFAEEGLGWRWDRDLYRELLKTTGGKERMRADIRDHGPKVAPDDAKIPEIHKRKTARYAALMAAGEIALRPGIAALIEDARARDVRVAVATTTNLPNVDALTRACWGKPADEVFDVIAAGDMVAAKKPAPDVYLLALERLGLDPADCLAFEDSRNGLLSARAAGLRCIVSPGPYTADQDFAEAGAVLDCFSEVSTIDRLRALFPVIA
ncbi:HAD family hydrolase [Jhaorihella thermophila]|uniref:Haloacid dehalogenase superfamily, subfamily IA, variant 3 with third motif having DD or ED n=1 Tax=Jhaorihella thermophila TaxID=488547 RepID=A0A1H5XL59_9RHOB|nr:HAD family hydrolase [Jhaorihella thermophila]SEG12215.1 haloacid dehalogenase superfamily, subfamily IA, variant 3 with third motif having DD or ED [Jhaorihella thermophila]